MPDRTICAVFSLAAALAVFLAPDLSSASDGGPAVRFVDENIPKFRAKKEMIAEYGARYDVLHNRLIERNRAGEDLPCSTQILNEVGWWIKYSTERETVERRLDDLERSLAPDYRDQSAARKQSAEDGSWGGCYEPWFFRAWNSVDPLREVLLSGERPEYPLHFLKEVETPELIAARLRGLIVSRPAKDGRNNRKELNLTVTGLGQLLWLPLFEDVVSEIVPRAALGAALIEVMDEEWQDPETGYWGAWYEADDGRIVKTEDLSITFHIVSYRSGDVPRREKLIETLFLTRERPYPYGWQDRGTQNTHHTYDVVRIIELVWPDLDAYQRARARAEIVIILSRALRIALQQDGSFDPAPYNSVAEAYYFGVSLLDAAGYLDPEKRFWAEKWKFEARTRTRARIIARLEELDSDAPMAKAALRKLYKSPEQAF
ncbi:hypothetical protein NUH88_14190 [Nisaea acidiphila]|uniref:Uncharacterized protein n=1 Tax=Nisaea acidiphila TaxID=1862145 RepID=A0A9J7AN02_9PROT|nr:hypothetical protein [Nisaea acidiphila]UUX48559.1 hypothetical protein NUH88_14190 [Nisaea acidiphila]